MHGSLTDAQQRYDAAFDVIAENAGGQSITVPDAHLLFSGDFKRSGDTLAFTRRATLMYVDGINYPWSARETLTLLRSP